MSPFHLQITLEDRVRLKTPSPLSPTCATPTICRIEQPRRIHLKPEDKKLVVRSPTDKFYLPIYNFTIESKRNLLEQHVVVKIMSAHVRDFEEHPLGGTLPKMHPFAEPKNVTIKPHLLYRLPETMGEIPVYGISIHSEKGTHHVEELYSKNAKVVRRIQERCDHLELTVISPHYHWARRFWRSWKKLVQPFRVIFGKSEWMG
uniref:Uncharacterized protein n=1 Tax=Branchiostoma floridae TaxID=7739 RepID=C3YMQ3_BRAFL|eukprot:XP_002602382.1 hypothetical protein BRAFLDRAFT_63537 [Branchiostoma floridae]